MKSLIRFVCISVFFISTFLTAILVFGLVVIIFQGDFETQTLVNNLLFIVGLGVICFIAWGILRLLGFTNSEIKQRYKNAMNATYWLGNA